MDADGNHFYKLGRTRSRSVGQRLLRYNVDFMAQEHPMTIVTAVALSMFNGAWQSKRVEHIGAINSCNATGLL